MPLKGGGNTLYHRATGGGANHQNERNRSEAEGSASKEGQGRANSQGGPGLRNTTGHEAGLIPAALG